MTPTEDTGLLSPVWAGTPAEEATGDAAYLRAMLDAEVALARAQAAEGVLPQDAADAIAAAAAGDFDVRAMALRARRGGNPVIPLVEELRAVCRHAHQGATSQDVLDTAAMLVADRVLALVREDLGRLVRASGALAERHRDTPCVARTLTQHAAPSTFGLKAAGWRALALAAHRRLGLALPAQLGGPVGTLAGLAPDAGTALRIVAGYARELGLAEPVLPWHTLRTPVADLAGALGFAAGALGKIAGDVLVLARTEIGEVAEAEGGPSSSMPHKANPVRSVLVASAARQVPALTAVLYASLAAEDERPPGAWHAEWQPLREALRLVGGAARHTAALVEGLRVDGGRMRANLDAAVGVQQGTGAAGELVDRALAEKDPVLYEREATP